MPKRAWVPIPTEALTILIILVGMLAGLLLPAVCSMRRNTERVHAESTAYTLKNAIATYHVTYRKYPLPNPIDDITLDSDHSLMDILLGSDPQRESGGHNPLGIAFYSDVAAKPLGGGRYRVGLTSFPDGTGELWDPWGNHYRTRFDTDENGQVADPESTKPDSYLPEAIAVWSAGPDGIFETWNDNLKTW
jgi:type II secretory pathway pseudopilin PulG